MSRRMHCVVTFSVFTPSNDRERKEMTVRNVTSPHEAIARVQEEYGFAEPIIYTGYAVYPDDLEHRLAYPFDGAGDFYTRE